MQWRRTIDLPYFYDFFIGTTILLLFASIYLEQLFFIGVVALATGVISKYYVHYVTEHIELLNVKRTIRMFPDDEEILILTIRNNGRLPIFNSVFSFYTDNAITIFGIKELEAGRVKDSYSLVLTLMSNEIKEYHLKLKAKKRGPVRISEIKFEVNDLLGMVRGVMYFEPLYKTEMIVYPTPLPVKGIKRIIQIQQGDLPYTYSYFQDPTLTVGTRDYVSGDSFKQIHWKASARKPILQTKVLEKTTSVTWVILLNITNLKGSTFSTIDPNLEKNISYTAFLCQYAVQQNIPFRLYVNVRTRGKTPIFHLDVGRGRTHLMKAFELLARIRHDSITAPMFQMLNIVERRLDKEDVVIMVGDISVPKEEIFYGKWKTTGQMCYQIDETGITISLTRQGKGKVLL